jgi:hypothetical protein
VRSIALHTGLKAEVAEGFELPRPRIALGRSNVTSYSDRESRPHLGEVLWHNSVTSHFIHLAMFYWAFDLPLLATMYRYWPRLVRFSWCMHHGFSHHMHHTSPRRGASTLNLVR